MLKWAITAIILGAILVTAHTGAFATKPWDLLITAKFEQDQIGLNEQPVLVGTILDQKGEPVFGAKVQIRFADSSVSTTTDEEGNFRYEFGQAQTDGIFSASITATVADLKGMGKASVKIGTGVSTFDDLYYSRDFDKETKNDPYKSLKQKQYQKFIEEQNKRKLKQNEIEAKKLALQEKRDISEQRRSDAVNATKPGAGVYSYDEQEQYIAKKDPRLKAMIRAQMDHTRQIYEEAKYEMKKILDAGGSLEDARKAYFEKLATTHEEAQKVGAENNTENHSKKKTQEERKISSKKVKGLTYNKYFK
ncbi:carboxypeptidase-like regulatory domain-containing protein [Candidatus Nitrosotenuis aquarius]|uniref:carboxypeptidase-like regulatory domain-containing protein n=1 Tax=Candidatus Nitrosotenuis aquarius TaxID=1846278 RepID=UPI0013C2A88A|nr:carboxypeptidase-like regulatory domain-containing protein [Candidatus Nitrosotenuis aquarius]